VEPLEFALPLRHRLRRVNDGPTMSTIVPPQALDPSTVRDDFPILEQEINGRPLVYLDNAASAQKPRRVLRAIERLYATDYANVHRGIHELSRRATEAYEGARAKIAAFLGITDPAELILTSGTTAGLNLVAWSWGTANLRPGDEILLSVLEHHSNIVPWQLAAERTGARLRFLELDDGGHLELSALDELIGERTRIVSLAHVSNALGTINPITEIGRRARERGAIMVVDGAQSAPHLPIDVAALECDFFAFSGHKMYGPTGVGGLWGRRELLSAMPPFLGGGDMIDLVELERSTYADLPYKFEAGTPNIAGVIGLGSAVEYLTELGMTAVQAHGQELQRYALERLAAVPDLVIHGPGEAETRAGVVSFTLADIHPHDLATILDSEGIAIRAGHHCCQPLMRRLGVGATARASFGVYNTIGEVDRLAEGLENARSLFGFEP
jgi:cysteine desulfurase / selenocysteine lyase